MSALEDAIAAVLRGELVVIPTDTVYGIGCRPDYPDATARVFGAKGRPRDLELPILVADVFQARSVAHLDDRASVLCQALWPGALTLVLPRAAASRGWQLGGNPDTVGVRAPGHPLALALLAGTGPMAVTSANPSGVPPLTDAEALVATFGDEVAIYLCEDQPLVGVASTVVDLTGDTLSILRQGSVTAAAIDSALG
jgi:L-threonylcarbamoyladenylate synthase